MKRAALFLFAGAVLVWLPLYVLFRHGKVIERGA